MSANNKEDRAKTMFESRFLSILLMIALIIMCSLFIVIVWTLFGKTPAINVIIYLSIGIGAGICFTLVILLISLKRQIKLVRNILLYLVAIILVVSLIISLILKFTISDPDLASWAFINASSVGLGLTSGIALTYLLLAMFKTPLIYGKDEKKEEITPNTEVIIED